ncbi:hypothetical protein C8Q75DRAFT_719501 [Abortiporus biennis]|nr:hypothetical protein C8Q75DRAFT_719501 [Abortiporus biennis]
MSRNRRGPQGKGGGARRAENNKIYGDALPITFPLSTDYNEDKSLSLLARGFRIGGTILNPNCEVVFDKTTRSAWTFSSRDAMILWRKGFFGKGDLSRSEPSWLSRQINALKAAKKGELTSEEIREKRRAERKQFKIDRAKAIADAAAEAEAAFIEGREANTTFIPSGATWKPQQQNVQNAENVLIVPEEDEESGEAVLEEDEIPQDVEHLQLTLQETFFLSWAVNCLTVHDPTKESPMTLQEIWTSFQAVHCITPSHDHRFDNPFIINYAIYHYYRSLGWIVKGGLKFCVDYLLYKRGPVFQHAEFAIMVIPVYEDPADQENSPFQLENSDPMSWTWLSTINRVNSQVQKTLVLTYITIPAQSRISPTVLSSPACLSHYTIREVVLRRFIPARMRD